MEAKQKGSELHMHCNGIEAAWGFSKIYQNPKRERDHTLI